MTDLMVNVSDRGQLTIPAEFRHRWKVKQFLIVDNGTSLELVPVPDDPVEAFEGCYAGLGRTADEMRADDLQVETAKDQRHGFA